MDTNTSLAPIMISPHFIPETANTTSEQEDLQSTTERVAQEGQAAIQERAQEEVQETHSTARWKFLKAAKLSFYILAVAGAVTALVMGLSIFSLVISTAAALPIMVQAAIGVAGFGSLALAVYADHRFFLAPAIPNPQAAASDASPIATSTADSQQAEPMAIEETAGQSTEATNPQAEPREETAGQSTEATNPQAEPREETAGQSIEATNP